VLEDVAVEQIALLTLEGMAEIQRDANGLSRPLEHRDLSSEVGRKAPALVNRQASDLRSSHSPELVVTGGSSHSMTVILGRL
jgi:hypothetical protein